MAVRHEHFDSVSKQQKLMRLDRDSLPAKSMNANSGYYMVMTYATQKSTPWSTGCVCKRQSSVEEVKEVPANLVA